MNYVLRLLLCLSTVNISAQTAESGVIHYKHVINIFPDYKRNEEGIPAILYFTADKSCYYFNRDTNPKITTDIVHTTFVGTFDGGYQTVTNDRIGEQFYKDFKTKQFLLREFAAKKAYIVDEVLPMIKWIIKSETKKISNIDCQKATTAYKGRNYEAWFAPSIPISAGPWKFHGLPGLILEVYDEKKEVQFLFNSLAIDTDVKAFIVEPQKAVKKINVKEAF